MNDKRDGGIKLNSPEPNTHLAFVFKITSKDRTFVPSLSLNQKINKDYIDIRTLHEEIYINKQLKERNEDVYFNDTYQKSFFIKAMPKGSVSIDDFSLSHDKVYYWGETIYLRNYGLVCEDDTKTAKENFNIIRIERS